MILESLKMKNYRQYVDETIIFAKPEGIKNFTIIQGANGSGKTNILNALTWCLYGKEKHLGEKARGLPIVSLAGFDPDEKRQVELEIHMLDDESKKIIFKRTLTFHKTEKGVINRIPDPLANSEDGSKFEILREIKNDMNVISNPNYVLNIIIPEAIEEYFFFDGERLNDYFKDTKGGKKIRQEVFKISQLDLLQNTLDHLNVKRKDFERDFGALSPKAKEIQDKVDTLENSLNTYKEDLQRKVSDKDNAIEKEKEFSDKLRTVSVATVNRLQEDRDGIERDLIKIEKELEETETKKLKYLIKMTPFVFAYSPVIKTTTMIAGREEAGDIPPNYKRNFIEKLLKNGKCICGINISNDDEYRKNVIELLSKCGKISDISDELIKENMTLKSIIDEVKIFDMEITSENDKIRILVDEKKEKTEKLNEISEEIKKYGDFEQISLWENKRKEYEDLKNELLEEIGDQKGRIKLAEQQISELKNRAREELDKSKKYEMLKRILVFCNQSLVGLEKIKNEIMEDLRKELEEKTKTHFFELIWKKETYKDVKLSEDYVMSVIHQSGLEAIGTLAAGERQVLALSFMAALNSVSGFDVPIIIDTPLGRIGREPRRNIAKMLPNYLKDKQAILLVTEEEYTQDVRERLFERVGKEYRIDFAESKDGGRAKVVLYG